jgi:hypothetical protein
MMSSETDLELRMAAVEEAVAELRQQFATRPGTRVWLNEVAGSISDEAAFEEALEYGRAFRQADEDDGESAA